ncbi:LptF/LptG family permease [Myxosarcina sp. GI1(2024)]
MAKYLSFKLSVIDRYIASELSIFFLFSVGLLSSVGVAVGTISDLVYQTTEYNIPIYITALIFCYQVPEYVGYALPISMLLTTLVIYGRLNGDRELIAMGSVGISIYRLVVPALVVSSLVTCLTFFLNELVVPAANYRVSIIQNNFIPETQLSLAQTDIFYPEYQNFENEKKLKNIYYARKFSNQKLYEITILSWLKDRLARIITAEQAQWSDRQQVWQLTKVKINFLAEDITELEIQEHEQLQLKLSPAIFKMINRERTPEAMNISQAREYLDIIKYTGRDREIKLFQVRIHQKIAFPFICVVFTLIGSALGINFTQIGRAKGFGICIIVVFLYYFLGFASGTLGIVGLVSPRLAAWLPNLIGFGLGIRWLNVANS